MQLWRRLWQWLRDGRPKRPVNLRVVLQDGSELPAPCVYWGRANDGQCVWVAVSPAKVDQVVALAFDSISANTDVVLARVVPQAG